MRLVRWLRWHCPQDTGFKIRALAVWGRARYLSVTEAPHKTDFHTWMGKKHFLFLSNRRDREPEPRTLAWRAAVLTTTPGPPDHPHAKTSQQTRYINPMLVQCWASVKDGGPTLYQHWVNVWHEKNGTKRLHPLCLRIECVIANYFCTKSNKQRCEHKLRGLVKLKTFQKNPRKNRINQTSDTHPPPYPSFFVLKHLQTWKQPKKHEKHNISKKKIIWVEACANPPTS